MSEELKPCRRCGLYVSSDGIEVTQTDTGTYMARFECPDCGEVAETCMRHSSEDSAVADVIIEWNRRWTVSLIVSHSTGAKSIAKCRVSATSSGRRRRRKRHLNGSNRRSRAGQGRTLSRLKRNVASSKRRGGEIRNVICDLSGTEAEGGVVDGIS